MILVVEDEFEWQEKFISILSDLGYDYRLVSDFEAALLALSQERPLLLLLDLKVPSSVVEAREFNGWILAQQAVERDVPTIIVTAYPTLDGARTAFRDFKVIDFLDKATLSTRNLTKAISEAVKESLTRRLGYQEKENLLEEMRKVFSDVLLCFGFRQVELVKSNQHNLAAIRSLVRDSFTASELKRFCQDHPLFRPIPAQVPENPSLEELTDAVLGYCERNMLFSELLSEIRVLHPRQYQRYYAQIYGSDAEAADSVGE